MRVLMASLGLLAAPIAYAAPPPPVLPAPYATPSSSKGAAIVGWGSGKPTAPPGFVVTRYAGGFESGRWLYQLPNRDILVAEAHTGNTGAGRITLLRDSTQAGTPDVRSVFLTNVSGNLNAPFGMALVGSTLFVASTDGLWAYPYTTGATSLPAASGTKVLDLPASGYNNHWTRNVMPSLDQTKLYVTVGSGTNVDTEHSDSRDPRRAAILEYAIATRAWHVFASGLRNPNGLDWNPVTHALWTAVNERDGLGDGLVPDFTTSVQPGGFYGWPYLYFGTYVDPRHAGERPDLAGTAIVPDVALGAHHAPLGLVFYRGRGFPLRFRGGMFVAEHGSWNDSHFAGYRVAFVPFDQLGHPSGTPQTFLGGFVADEAASTVRGRPVDVLETSDGALLVTDDANGCIWRVTYAGPQPETPSIASLMLYDATTGLPIEPLASNQTVSFAREGTTHLSIVAEPGSVSLGSVRFALDGYSLRVENNRPYAIAGDDGRGHVAAWTPSAGWHLLTLTPYTGSNGTGTSAAPVTWRFEVRK